MSHEEKIKRMTKHEKVAEFKAYLGCAGLLNLDVDQIMADQVAVGAPDSALHDALLKCAILAGSTVGVGRMLTAQELAEALKAQGPRFHRHVARQDGSQDRPARGLTMPQFSLRRSARLNDK